MKNERTITDFINNEVKEYAISVVEERAIPSIVDGFKPVQRKLVYTANRVAKNFIKTAALVGNVISVGGYYKGDASIAAACGNMAQDFPGSNNVPFIKGSGEFGKRLTPNGIAAPRYTKAMLHPNFNKFFTDSELLEYEEQDGEFFEPKYYLPSVPTVLLNGISGIAVGFACKILPYKLTDIIQNVGNVLRKKPQFEMTPYYGDFKGTIDKVDDKWVMRGVWRKINKTTIEITELPIGISREKYLEHLNKLEDAGLIKSYDDHCKKEFRFVIYMAKGELNKWVEKEWIERKFKLAAKLSENLNLISEKGKLISFDSANEIIEYFVKLRLKVLTARKEYFSRILGEKIEFAQLKVRFIRRVMDGEIDFNKISNKDNLRVKVKKLMAHYKPSEDDIERLINISIYHLNDEEIRSIKKKRKEHETAKAYYEKTPENKLFVEDLKRLVK